ncbi:19491efb-8c08-4b95-b33b-697bf766285e-CDS [Sclerotinia trifoliorum]|uniref:Arginine N-methyltransferase 2 n=1 Tax=Sclerotinia trifoliorum TaxID=28548 RepID=A0A8H2VZT3_9HELO|nr:19491efb-8c08-4b95-b33b-697bf766285e-CDS [Sclerotinia trifoliorum]
MDDPAFATETDSTTQAILLAAANHDLPALKPLLRVPGAASVQDPETGFTPLHAAIASCEDSPSPEDIEAAKATIKELFLSGAIWNDLDTNNETPGCLAYRLGRKELYELVVDAGVRAEILMNLMGGYEELSDGEDDEEDEVEEMEMETGDGVQIVADGEKITAEDTAEESVEQVEVEVPKKDVNSADYLQSKLEFTDDKLLDADANGVMMAWEATIMQRTVDLLIPASSPPLRILNIGFGMGIIDTMFASASPASHHIIEAHPDVLAHLQTPGHKFGKEWEASAPEEGSYKIHAGRWQEILPTLLEENLQFDVIYFDTFGESYMELKKFFSEYVIGLLSENGKFSFFNGLGADRKVCYDVYTKVAELDLCDAGLDVDWTEVEVEELGGEGEGEWKGVRRRYWVLDKYRLPICGFMG